MANITISGTSIGTPLMQMLDGDPIEPGDPVSYELCKTILLYHPLGQRMAETPVKMAQSQTREISVPKGPEDRLVEAFEAEWKAVGADKHIRNVAKLARTYGIASIGLGQIGIKTARPLDLNKVANTEIYISEFDPLNTAGSLVLNQDPNSPDFLKHTDIAVSGTTWHRSRVCVLMNEEPVYISYTSSAFGFVGRSVYQRALYPLKTFIQSMITDDMVTQKAGLLIAKMKPAGSIVDKMMQGFAGLKRAMLQGAGTGNVLSISNEESIETLNMMNIDGAGGWARTNVIKNIATGADMPAAIIAQDTLTQGFGEGTEDAKVIAAYIGGLREWMQPAYDFMDPVVMRRAWNRDFYATIQKDYPDEYGSKSYEVALVEWMNSFNAVWPPYLQEPESERVKVDETKHKAIMGVMEVMLPQVGPINRAALFQWAADNLNENKLLFTSPLVLDTEEIEDWEPPALGGEDDEPKPKKPDTP